MAIKNLLVAYNGGAASDAALRFAIQMATKYDAHLTGVMAHGVSNISRNIPIWFSGVMRESIKGAIAQKSNDIGNRFDMLARRSLPDDRVHWIEVGGDPDQTITDYAMLYDFTIVGQYENLVEADELELHPDRITFASGRPVLLIPKGYQATDFNERAVLAWDGNRTATRALADAMQVLETKDTVTVATVETHDLGTPLEGIDITTVLDRHGITSNRVFLPRTKESVAHSIMEFCDEVEARLLVMGAYESSKSKQDLVGGVTSTVMKNSKIPVLMSH